MGRAGVLHDNNNKATYVSGGIGTWALGRDDLDRDPIVRVADSEAAVAELRGLLPQMR